MQTYTSFTVALMATLMDINQGGPDHHADAFTIAEVGETECYRVEGAGWAFYLARTADGWAVRETATTAAPARAQGETL